MSLKNFFQILFLLLMGAFLTACAKKTEEAASDSAVVADSAPAEAANADISSNEKLGTKWGDDVSSHVTKVDLHRVSGEPIAEASIRYASKNFKGKAVNSLSIAAGKVNFSVVDDQGKELPMIRDGKNYYVKAKEGQSYQLRYENNTSNTYEIVASVDGLDVLNGQEASKYSSGYVLNTHDTLSIEGFRKSDNAVASFTFGKPDESYAANSSNGSIDNTGIIGTVVFELSNPEPVAVDAGNEYAPAPNAFPGDKN